MHSFIKNFEVTCGVRFLIEKLTIVSCQVRTSNSVAANDVCLILGSILHSHNVQVTGKCWSLKKYFAHVLTEYCAVFFRILTITVYCM